MHSLKIADCERVRGFVLLKIETGQVAYPNVKGKSGSEVELGLGYIYLRPKKKKKGKIHLVVW